MLVLTYDLQIHAVSCRIELVSVQRWTDVSFVILAAASAAFVRVLIMARSFSGCAANW